MDIAAGEYGYNTDYVRRMLARRRRRRAAGGCVALPAASPASCRRARCATRTTSICPAIARRRCICTAPAPRRGFAIWNGSTIMCASSSMLFDGAPAREERRDRPDLSRPGLGLDFKQQDAERYAA